uniref:Uncharacterized protein n=1 Tax=Dulem virus 261 TaxID=3145738 RepID=A0AAU8B6B9_9VIRU
MSYKPTYDTEEPVQCNVVLSYLSPLRTIETVIYSHVSPQKLYQINRILKSK